MKVKIFGIFGEMMKIKLTLQAAIYITSLTQGDALGYYKLAFQAKIKSLQFPQF